MTRRVGPDLMRTESMAIALTSHVTLLVEVHRHRLLTTARAALRKHYSITGSLLSLGRFRSVADYIVKNSAELQAWKTILMELRLTCVRIARS